MQPTRQLGCGNFNSSVSVRWSPALPTPFPRDGSNNNYWEKCIEFKLVAFCNLNTQETEATATREGNVASCCSLNIDFEMCVIAKQSLILLSIHAVVASNGHIMICVSTYTQQRSWNINNT